MLDIKFILENKEQVKKAVKDKGLQLDVEKLALVYERRNELLGEREKLQGEKNKINETIISALDKETLIKEGKAIKEKINQLEPELKEFQKVLDEMLLLVPNIPSPDSPVGPDEKSNQEIAKWGEIPKFAFKIKDHLDLGKSLDLIDTEKGVKTAGFRGYYLKNEAVWLQMALMQHALSKMQEKDFSLMITPTIIKEFALVGSGHFPFGKEEVYELTNPGKDEAGKEIKEKMYLAGTSEPSLLAYFANETLPEKDLPKKVCGFSTCYRSEVGSYGKDTRGIYRMHEFMKVEQVVICKADIQESNQWLETMREIAEEMLQELKLPHRVLNICTGDMGAGKYKMYDIETWMPSREAYGETHSDSNLTDWQARRLNIKYKDKEGKIKYAYTLNNTVIASPRILIAILENYQQKDGGVKIPEVLQKYMPKGMKKISPKK
jgi:seryl-tRNA synthetase